MFYFQVVLTSTNPSEICINGMSFSRRASKWANAALVVTVTTKDFESLNLHGHFAGVEFQVYAFPWHIILNTFKVLSYYLCQFTCFINPEL